MASDNIIALGHAAARDFYVSNKPEGSYTEEDIDILGSYLGELIWQMMLKVEVAVDASTTPIIDSTPEPVRTLMRQLQVAILSTMKGIKISE